MKLTKKIEAEILKINSLFWDRYLQGDCKTVGTLFTDDYRFIGTAEGEVFHSKKAAMKFLKATIDQIAGVMSRKNIETKINTVGESVVVYEFFDGYVNASGESKFYGSFRITTIMKRVRGKWMIAHHHGSMPDSNTEQGETLGAKKIEEENRQLRNAVRRHTKELENKNRDLEIESSLERVRARAMAMQSTSELADLIGMIYTELRRLDMNFDRCFIMLFDEPTGDATWWMASGETTSLKRGYHLPFHKHPPHLAYLKGWKKQESIWQYILKGDVKKKWDSFIFTKTELAQFPREVIKNMKVWKVAHLSASFNRYGCITSGTFSPLETASLDLLARFSRMFEQTYTRFLDLQNAEAQARESQIQLALERVRARTMAMQKSEELNDVATLLFQQVSQLGIKTWTTGFNVWGNDNNSYTDYITSPQGNSIDAYTIDASKFPVFVEVADARKSGVDFLVQYLEGDLLKETYKELSKFGDDGQFKKILEDGFQFPSQQYDHFVFGDKVSLMFITYEAVPEGHDIFKRFGKVFEQTYTRFLDLKKAEAQAHEAQIEVALEKVRSTSLAMHHSDELEKVVAILFDKLDDIGVHFDGALIYTFDKGKRSFAVWVATKALDAPIEVKLPYSESMAENAIIEDMWRAIDNGEHVFNKSYSGKTKDDYVHYTSKHNCSKVPDGIRDDMLAAESWTVTFAAEKNSVIGFDSWAGLLTSDEDFQVLKRFSRVFEQAYVRFLDLQKAEAQAREAQIEAALERVRSRTMAMHKSEELLDVITVVCEQLLHVDIKFSTVSFGKNSSSFNMDFWAAAPDLKTPIRLSAPFAKIPIYERLKEAYLAQTHFFTDTFTADETRIWYEHLIDHNPAMFSQKSREYLTSRPAMTRTTVLSENVFLFAINHDLTNYSNEENEILIRFANVFEQAYTRFLDLQKAEAQAREAHIEAALERVRSRTMAMQKSEDLRDVTMALYEQLTGLGFKDGTSSIIIMNAPTGDIEWWMEGSRDGYSFLESYRVRYFDHPGHIEQVENWKKGIAYAVISISGEAKRAYDKVYFSETDFIRVPEATKALMMQAEKVIFSMAYMRYGALSWSPTPISDDQAKVLQRFAKVFEQTYTRFLDLQKAEAQARESQIQLALERIRARTMAMQRSDELAEVSQLFYQQFLSLGVETMTCAFMFVDEKKQKQSGWTVLPHGTLLPRELDFPLTGDQILDERYASWKEKKELYHRPVEAEENKRHHQFLSERVAAHISEDIFTHLPERINFYSANYADGYLLIITVKVLSEEEEKILVRFTKTFEQTYTRFLDLQKAEEQARESQIEAALERVRAKAMAMHTAQQLSEVVSELRKQMGMLGQRDLDTCVIHLNEESPDFIQAWAAMRPPGRSDEIREFSARVPKRGLTIIEENLEAYAEGRKDYVIMNAGDKMQQWVDFMRQTSPEAHQLILDSIEGNDGMARAFWTFAVFPGGSLLMVTIDEPDQTSRTLLRRFANVFGLTYRRFSDLKKAEAQAREASIETALEKIRSRSLGMHRSEEILDVVGILFEKLKELGLVFDGGAAIHLFSEGSRDATIWVASPDLNAPIANSLPYDAEEFDDNPIILDVWRAKETGENIINRHYSFEQKNKYFNYLFKYNDFVKIPEPVRDFIRNAKSYSANFITEKNSLLGATSWTGQEFSENDIDVLKRVARVFEQAYVRFLDLKKVEAQAREATIEASLERIRSRSLGMHRSVEILDVVAMLFEKLKELGLVFDGGAAIHLFSEDSRDSTIWVAAPELNVPVVIYLPYDEELFADNPIITDIWRAKETGESLLNRKYQLEHKNKYFSYLFKYSDSSKTSQAMRDFILAAEDYTVTLIAEKNSLLGANSWTGQRFSDADVDVLKRVSRVFEQAYVRFLDLQKAEAHAREAIQQASLDRVRAEIASMRTVRDLDRITPLIWRELTALDIPFIRCGVFIMDEKKKVIHNYLSTPEGNAIAVFHLPYDTPGFASKVLKRWQEKKMLVDHWDENGMKDFANILVTRGIFTSPDQYLSTLPKEGFYLHVLPFLQGMLYVGNLSQLKNDQLDVLQSLADAFATAYARYDDFNRLELAKQQVDNTLVELKQAQQQLVQSEKMASLGELTAGIAHEIQNPLNFVNNFSEVSKELLDEVKEALNKNNTSEVETLIADIVQNLEKINFHGQRADAIVKSMLQHSRKGSGQKELTDLNALSDEYVRLAYHGFRAKDKSFNAKFELKLDSSVPKVKVLPQDIGRVLLNLINNSFYAISEKSKQNTAGYEPLLTLSTKRLNEVIEIRVRDNGNGIPDSIKEKIFQPFFTTKPTGQGTGLGLSLSYDIVKVHGGSMECNSKEGEGSEFIIVLPVGVE